MEAGCRVVFADRGARLHRYSGNAPHPGIEFDHMGGGIEGRGCGRRIANFAVEDDIGRVPPGARRTGFSGVPSAGDQRDVWT